MTECRCPNCSDAPLPTYTERYRHKCEVRYVAGLPKKEDRSRYLRHVALKRGAAAAQQIIASLRVMHRARNWKKPTWRT